MFLSAVRTTTKNKNHLSNCPSCSLNFPVSFITIHLHVFFSAHHYPTIHFRCLSIGFQSIPFVHGRKSIHHPSQISLSIDWLVTLIRFSCSAALHKPRSYLACEWIVFVPRGFSLSSSLIEQRTAKSIHPLWFIEGGNDLKWASHLFGLFILVMHDLIPLVEGSQIRCLLWRRV